MAHTMAHAMAHTMAYTMAHMQLTGGVGGVSFISNPISGDAFQSESP